MEHKTSRLARSTRLARHAALAGTAALALAGAAAAARAIDPYQSTEVKPVTAKPVATVTSTAVKAVGAKAVKPGTATSPSAAAAAGSAFRTPASLVGAWRTWVPGGTVQHDVVGDPTKVEQVTSGPAAGTTLRILAGGTWRWHGLAGRWTATGDASYPIVLHRALQGRDWKVGGAGASLRQSQKAEIVLTDGFSPYMGKR